MTRAIAIAALVVSLTGAAVYILAAYVIWMEGSCPSNQCEDDRVILGIGAVVVLMAIAICFFATRALRRSTRDQTQKGPPSRS